MDTGKQLTYALNELLGRGELASVVPIKGGANNDVEPLWEPDDLKTILASAIGAVATGSGGTELKFGREGIIVPGQGTTGIYWARSVRQRWSVIVGGRMIAFAPDTGFYVGVDSSGIAASGLLSMEFYLKPKGMSWPRFRDWVEAWTRGLQGGAAGTSAGAVPAATTSAAITGKNYNGTTYDSKSVPGTGARTVQIGLDTGTPPGLNDPAAVFCLASSAALSQAGTGIIMTPGGNVVWPGGPAFLTEIADLGVVVGDYYASVTY